jgi:hypothetical protein
MGGNPSKDAPARLPNLPKALATPFDLNHGSVTQEVQIFVRGEIPKSA